MEKSIRLLFIFIFFQYASFSQNKNLIDSVLADLKVKKDDTTKVRILNNLALDYLGKDPGTSIYFGNEALKLSEKLNDKMGQVEAYLQMSSGKINLGNYEEALEDCKKVQSIYEQWFVSGIQIDTTLVLKLKARTLENIGVIYWHQVKYSEALNNHSSALKIRENVQDKHGIALSLNHIGVIYADLFNYSEALKYYFAALKIREEIGDKGNMAASLINIGIIYAEQEDYSEALDNFISALKIFEEFGDKVNASYTLNNIGTLYNAQGNLPEALNNYTKALKIQIELGNKRGIATTSENIGVINSLQGNLIEAKSKLLNALKIKEEIGDKSGLAITYNNLGNVYILQKKVKEANQYLNMGLALAKEIGDLETIHYSYLSLAELDSLEGNFEQAFKHYKLYISYRDSVDNEENKRTLLQKQMQYDFDKKVTITKLEQEKRDVVIQQQLQRQKIIRNSFIAGSVLLVMLLFVIINRNKLKRTIEMERVRSRLSRDLHDDIGSTLSSINILSRTAQTHLDPASDEKTRVALEKINERCQRLLDNMRDIIWNINPGNDTLEEVMSRMREYAATLLEAKQIDYTFNFPKETMDCQLTMDVKNNMYLIFKEAINNLSKYAACTKTVLTLTFDDKNIYLTIEDNGKGFDKDEIKQRGGLRNMHDRAEEIKGVINITSVIDKGTKVELTMPRFC